MKIKGSSASIHFSANLEHFVDNSPWAIIYAQIREGCFFAAISMYKILRLNKSKYLSAFFQRYQSRGPTRGNRKDLAIPGVRTDSGLLSFQLRCAHLWNLSPLEIFRRFQVLKTGFVNIFWNLMDYDFGYFVRNIVRHTWLMYPLHLN